MRLSRHARNEMRLYGIDAADLQATVANSYGGTVVKRLGWGLGDPRVWGARLRGRRAWRVRDARSDSYSRVGTTAGPCFVVRARSLRSSVTAWSGCS